MPIRFRGDPWLSQPALFHLHIIFPEATQQRNQDLILVLHFVAGLQEDFLVEGYLAGGGREIGNGRRDLGGLGDLGV